MFKFGRKKSDEAIAADPVPVNGEAPIEKEGKFITLPVAACGAGLFSDGYVANVIGSVSTIFGRLYPDQWTTSEKQVVNAIAFAGTVVGQLGFGYLSDKWSRTNSLLISTVILIVFTALCAGSYYHGSVVGMFHMLTAWRFFVGIGLGGEYPAGSVACAESTGEVKKGWRHMVFILFTNSMIDLGFVIGAFVPYVVAAACHNGHLSTQWRVSLAIGCVFPCILFVMRLFVKEPEEFQRESMRHARTPYKLALKFYGWRLFIFLTYAFGIYSSTILAGIYPSTAPLTTIFGWNTVINMFYLPGTLFGSKVSDWLGPKYTLVMGVTLQGIVGFIMAGDYKNLSKENMVAAFAVVYGIFLSLGELGPGNNIGLLASKSCATGVRGQYYGIGKPFPYPISVGKHRLTSLSPFPAAAFGKIGAFVGTYIYPFIEDAGGDSAVASAQYPFYVSSSLCFLSAVLTFFFMPNVSQDTIRLEDLRFREYLEQNGWDTAQLGLKPTDFGVDAGSVLQAGMSREPEK